MRSNGISIFCASLHLILFFVFVGIINSSNDGQAPLLWVVFALIDFPVSLLYLVIGYLHTWASGFNNSFLSQICYGPHFIHGILGTFWWFFLPKIFLRIRKRKQ